MPNRLVAAACLAALIAVTGCATPPASFDGDQWSVDRLDTAPNDFTLDLALRRGDRVVTAPEVQDRELRIVLMPNGGLHARIQERLQVRRPTRPLDDLPPLVRTLDLATVARVWTKVKGLGFADPEAGTRLTDPFSVPVPPEGRSSILSVLADERRWSFVDLAEDGVLDPAIVELTRVLADLAWAADDVGPTRRVIPRRYDLGGDPYARYR